MDTFTTVNSDGTVIIPKEIIEAYGILTGAQVHCVMNGCQLEMRFVGTKLPIPKTKSVSGYGMVNIEHSFAPADFDAAELFRNDRPGY
ncbi:hypothetical protein [Duganella callida]|uniref:Uncharacterized protein n=1 Tax=Duganella callida TaxID=2561932 RepID=A0A4Y9S0J1_9BURK|nr:hypothetical protein [Duganella callida]TFW14900.1 hypothetical protein E4L98_26840 [Duganella callida]